MPLRVNPVLRTRLLGRLRPPSQVEPGLGVAVKGEGELVPALLEERMPKPRGKV